MRQQPADLPRRAGGVVLALVEAAGALAAGEGDAGAVGRPAQLADPLGLGRQGDDLAGAVDREQVQGRPLLVAVLLPPAGEGEQAAVGRPGRFAVAVGAGGDLAGRPGAVGRGQPDGGAVAVGVEVGAPHRPRDQLAVGGHGGRSDLDQVADVVGEHGVRPYRRQPTERGSAESRGGEVGEGGDDEVGGREVLVGGEPGRARRRRRPARRPGPTRCPGGCPRRRRWRPGRRRARPRRRRRGRAPACRPGRRGGRCRRGRGSGRRGRTGRGGARATRGPSPRPPPASTPGVVEGVDQVGGAGGDGGVVPGRGRVDQGLPGGVEGRPRRRPAPMASASGSQ